MNTLPLLLAWRYLIGTHNEKSISTMARLCFGGVFIGTFSLALVLSIMHGFEHVTHEKFRGMHAPINIRAYGDSLDLDALAAVFTQEFPEIAAYSPSETRQVIIQTPDSSDISNIIALKGVVPEQETKINTLAQRMVTTPYTPTFVTALEGDQIILGKKLAEELNVVPGDTVILLFAREEQTRKQALALDRTTARVSAIFNSGIDEFDATLALCSLNFLQTLFPDAEPTHIGLTLKPDTDEPTTINRLRTRLGIEVFSWQDLYPALVAALRLEKYGMFLILALITLVASMNIISLLFMQITHKRGDIAILKAMGMPDTAVKNIFVLMGAGISLLGSLAGLIAAAIAGWLLDRYPLITLPDAYYVSHLPIRMTWSIFGLVFIVVLLLGLGATWIPARRTRFITIAKVLRMEA